MSTDFDLWELENAEREAFHSVVMGLAKELVDCGMSVEEIATELDARGFQSRKMWAIRWPRPEQ